VLEVIQVTTVIQVLTKVSLMGGLVLEISEGVAVGYCSMSFGGAVSMSAVLIFVVGPGSMTSVLFTLFDGTGVFWKGEMH